MWSAFLMAIFSYLSIYFIMAYVHNSSKVKTIVYATLYGCIIAQWALPSALNTVTLYYNTWLGPIATLAYYPE